jgi:hypothetical protein
MGAQVDVGLAVTPLSGQVGQPAVGGDERGLVVHRGSFREVAVLRGAPRTIAQVGHALGQRDAGRAGPRDERESTSELPVRIHVLTPR